MSLQLQAAPSTLSTIKRALRPTSGKIAVILSGTPLWKLIWQGIDAYGNVRMITDSIPSILSFLGSWPGAIVLMLLGFLLLWLQIRRQSAHPERGEVNEQLLGSADVHAQCKNTIRLLQDDLAVHSGRADTNESIFKRFEEKYKIAIRIADHQASEIGKFVEVVQVCTHDPKLEDPLPTIQWTIKLKNRSVHRISLDGDVGPLFFEGHKLTEHKEILENKIMGLYPDRQGGITFEQRLSALEVNLLKSSPNGKFEFDKVILHVKGSDAEHVTSHRVVIFSRFRAALCRCSDERSQAVEELLLETEREKIPERKALIASWRAAISKALHDYRIGGSGYTFPVLLEFDESYVSLIGYLSDEARASLQAARDGEGADVSRLLEILAKEIARIERESGL